MNNEDWINMFINKFNENKDYKITDVRDREKLLDELRPKGKWIEESVPVALVGAGNGQYRCSNCGHVDIQAKTQEVPYCWWCGARMER